ncbi:MAG: hypothetical protein K0M40_19715 [Prolixibacteraceae bacterium]|nr:hypothetical protein [Prolixibacteraceae bacterium]
MTESKFKVGDRVFHKSDFTVIWVIERINETEAFCSTLLKDSKKLVKENLSLNSIVQVEDNSATLIIGSRRRNNYY